MSYTPPAGSNVVLIFDGSYTPPAGDAVLLDLAADNPLNVREASVVSTLDDVSAVFAVISNRLYPVTLAATLDDVSAVIVAVAHEPANATIDATLDDVTAVFAAVAYEPANATLEATLDDVAVIIVAGYGVSAGLSTTLEDVQIDIAAGWQAGVFRGLETSRKSLHVDNTNQVRRQIGQLFNQGVKTNQLIEAGSAKPAPVLAVTQSSWFVIDHKRIDKMAGWDRIAAKSQAIASSYTAPEPKTLAESSSWQPGQPFSVSRGSAYRSPPRKPLEALNRYDEGEQLRLNLFSSFGKAIQTFRHWNVLPWDEGTPHSWIWGGWHYPPRPPRPHYIPSPDLVFGQWLLSTFHQGAFTIVLHTVNVIRLSDLLNIPALSANLKIDIDNWAWGVSLNLQTREIMALLEPVNGEPCQVRVEMDGVQVHALIEEWSEHQQFGETTYTATGRSPMALLAQPFAPIRSRVESSDQTAAQLIDFELLNTGWSAQYHTDLSQLFAIDWLVPGGAWSYQNKSPVEVITQIARAAGARAYADKTASVVRIEPRYPVSPWNWADATPDKTIPVYLVRSVASQLTPQPLYNQVYTSGQTQGVLVSGIRVGSAGDKPAPMVTDSLITHVDAGRERARNVLSNTGRQARVTLDLPLNAITGLLEPGQLVEVSDAIPWRGLVTSINVIASHSVVSQQVEIERHF